MSASIPAIPTEQNLLSHRIQIEGETPRKKFTTIFYYPDCVRSFDGREWKIIGEPVNQTQEKQ